MTVKDLIERLRTEPQNSEIRLTAKGISYPLDEIYSSTDENPKTFLMCDCSIERDNINNYFNS